MLRLPRLIRRRWMPLSLMSLALFSAVALAAACANSPGAPSSGFPPSGSGASGVASDNDGSTSGTFSGTFGGSNSGSLGPLPTGNADGGLCDGGVCTDFPTTPVVDNTLTSTDPPVPANAATLFGAAGSGNAGGPCIAEPADGALYPYNWLRPRVLWTPATGQTLFEVRFHATLEANDLVVYTTHNYWALDEATWQTIAGVEGGNPGTLVGQVITITVRAMAGTTGSPTVSNTASFTIAPAIADGSLIYWTTASFMTNATSTNLQGFHVGDEGTTTALTVAQVQQQVWAQPPDGGNLPSPAVLEPVGCIGCHTATPDGDYVGFTAQWPWPNALASVQADAGTPVGAAPPWLTPGAIANLGPNDNSANYLGGGYITATNNVDDVMLGIQTFSKAHYATGDRIEVAELGASLDQPDNSAGVQQPIQPACQGGTTPCVVSQLVWINLEWNGAGDAGRRPSAAPGALSNGGWGILARTGDSNSAGSPSWSHDGTTIAYTSVDQGTMDGRLQSPAAGTSADVKVIPYTANVGAPGGTGGAATALLGASDPAYNEYYPAFSPDDALIAFNRVPAAATMYDQSLAEVYVVPFNGGNGGTAVRLKANDPVACTNLKSPGVKNTWPKWAPNPVLPGDGGAPGVTGPQTINGLTYYWVTFSSTRSPTAAGNEQLYVAGIVVDSTGAITTYAPIYLWNQSDVVNNLIPAWGEFAIPPGKTPPPPPPPPK